MAMLENGKKQAILTKSYEIAYALFRIAGKIEEKDFSEKLRALGASLLEMAAGENYADTSRHLQIIECLIKFSGDVNMISAANANILLGEIYTLDTAIIEYNNAAKDDHINLADIFSKTDAEFTPPAKTDRVVNTAKTDFSEPANNTTATRDAFESAIAESFLEKKEDRYIAPTINSSIRQSAIVDKIRQSGNCRMRDIQEFLPDTSERTLRYDLQSLVEKNVIERVGTGGPSVFYRLPQVA